MASATGIPLRVEVAEPLKSEGGAISADCFSCGIQSGKTKLVHPPIIPIRSVITTGALNARRAARGWAASVMVTGVASALWRHNHHIRLPILNEPSTN